MNAEKKCTGVMGRMVKRALAVVSFLAAGIVAVSALPVWATPPAGTGVMASQTAAGHLTSTYVWSIEKSADPTTQMVAMGTSARHGEQS